MHSIFTKKPDGKKNINDDRTEGCADMKTSAQTSLVKSKLFTTEDSLWSTNTTNTTATTATTNKKNPNILESDNDPNDEYYQTVLSLDDIKKSIPETASNTPRPDLLKTHTEWRWRFFNIEGRKLVEISKLEPFNERMYVDNTSRWTKYTLDESWDKYVVDSRYYYAH